MLVIRKFYDILPKILEKENRKLKLRIFGEVFWSKDSKQSMRILYILQHFQVCYSIFEYLIRKCDLNR
jgi:hypothetical protein